ncbi:hypothetical protein D9M72_373370 [compost metagenome]
MAPTEAPVERWPAGVDSSTHRAAPLAVEKGTSRLKLPRPSVAAVERTVAAQFVSRTVTPPNPFSAPFTRPSFGTPEPSPLSLKTRPVSAKPALLTNVHWMSAPATIRAAGIPNTFPVSVPKVTVGVVLASTQLALTGFAGQPVGANSPMLAATPTEPVIASEPVAEVASITVMASRVWLRPDNANSNRLLPLPLATRLTIRTRGTFGITGTVTALMQAPVPLQARSPPPVAVAVLETLGTASAFGVTGMSYEIVPLSPAATVHVTT